MIGERRTEVGSEGGVDPGVAVTEFREQWELLHFNFQKWSKMGSCTDHLSLPLSLWYYQNHCKKEPGAEHVL